ncbi:hypothetical protein ACFLTP_00410 [Chloroflexota bacterium]
MDEQHADFLEIQKERLPMVDMAIIAVVSGSGLADVFNSLGVAAIVPGGQTMNPSIKELLQAVNSVLSEKVVILPNNKNVLLSAGQVQPLTKKLVSVVPSETIPEGIAALLAFDYEAEFDTNVQIMTKAKSMVKTIEITRAVRSTKINGLKIKKKQAIGLLDGKLVAVGARAVSALSEVLSRVDLTQAEVITIYYGADTEMVEAEQFSKDIREQYPQLQIEVVHGGQPHHNYIVSVE